MAENKLIIGSLPVLRGAYDSATNYYRDNQVTMYGSTFQSLVDENVGYPPAELREDGKVYAINTDKWIIVANAIDAYNAGERIANAETRIKELGEYADSPEFIRVYTDANGKFLWGIRADGTVEWAKGVPTPVKEALRELESKINTDNNGKFEEIETSLVALQDAVDVINASFKPLTDTFSFQDSPEFVNVVTDAEGKVLEATQSDGKKYFPKQALLDKYDDVEGRTEITLDAENRVLAYRDKEGIKHEEKLALNEVYDKDNNKINLATKEDVENVTVDPSSINISELKGVSDHNTPNLLIADEMQKTFNDGTNSFTPPNEGYEMSNPIECHAGDWFTRTGTATGMVVVTDENDKNGTRLFNADGATLGNTFQIPADMTWVRYIRMAALRSGAEDGSVVICKGRVAYIGDDRGDYLTVDKLRVQNFNLPKDVKYLKSFDGKYWELYVDESHTLQIREIDPDVITELPSDFPVYNLSGDFTGHFDIWTSFVGQYLIARNENGVIGYEKVGASPALYADFRREKNSSGEIRYVAGLLSNGNLGNKGEQGLTIYDADFNVIETNINKGYSFDPHDFVYFDDNHVAFFFTNSRSNVNVPIDKDKSGYVNVSSTSASIVEFKKIDGIWTQIGRFNVRDYPQLLTDAFGIYSETEVLDTHQNTLFLDYDKNYVLNLRNNDSWIKIKRVENSDGTVTIGSKTLDYDEAIIGRVGGKYNSGYIDPKRVLEEGFSFTDSPKNLHARSTDEVPIWKFYHPHDIAYWGMKTIGDKQYPTYTLFDNNMWTGNARTENYIDINPRNNYSNNPNGNDDIMFDNSKSDSGGAYDTHMVSRVVQLSIDWDNHLIKEYKVYIIPKQYSYTRSGAQMLDEGVIFISWADQRICGLYDFNDRQTEVDNHVYRNGKEVFKCNTGSTWGLYRVHGYKK